MSGFDDIRDGLVLTDEGPLLLGEVPMILTPRWFFVGIMARVEKEAGRDCASRVFYDAAWDGAYRWAEVQIASGLRGRAVMEQYLGSMTLRGWGKFRIEAFDDTAGTATIVLHNSAVALEMGVTGSAVCYWIPGAMAGCMQAVLDHAGCRMKTLGREVSCSSQGNARCEFTVEASRV